MVEARYGNERKVRGIGQAGCGPWSIACRQD